MRMLSGILTAGVVLLATTANAVPVARTVVSTLSIEIQGLDSVVVTNTGTVVVDSTAGTISIPSGLVSVATEILIPLTASTTLFALRVKAGNLGNGSGLLSVGGVTDQASQERCAASNPGQACAIGGQIGGTLAMTGIVSVIVSPMAVTIPVNLATVGLGVGGSSNSPFTFDAAPWTNGTGLVATPNGPVALVGTGDLTGSHITFVTPTYLEVVGNMMPLFTTWELNFPEPGTLMLLGAGVAGLVMVGRRHR